MEDTKMREAIRSLATANVFHLAASEEKSKKAIAQLRSLPDELLNMLAEADGVPEDQYPIYRALVRNQSNVLKQELGSINTPLQAGDVILMTGVNAVSKMLVELQKPIYSKVRSSHVALVHADFVCVDAMPNVGVSNRIVSELLQDAADDWRIIRCKRLQDTDAVMRACAFYLAQPYRVLPAKRSAKKYAYCSELVRKIYSHCKVSDVNIATGYVIAPAHFDMLADGDPNWIDITDQVRPAVEFCRKYHGIMKMEARLLVEGIKLNRKRFNKRTELLENIKKLEKEGEISKKEAQKLVKVIHDIESNVNHTFWDVQRSAK